MKGFIEVKATSGIKIMIAVEYIAMIFDGSPCYIRAKSNEDWSIEQTYEEVLCLITKAMKEGGE